MFGNAKSGILLVLQPGSACDEVALASDAIMSLGCVTLISVLPSELFFRKYGFFCV